MSAKITKIGVTNDKISARGGLPFFLRYVEQTGLYGLISKSIAPLLPKSSKGLHLQGFIKQMLAVFIDATDLSMVSFDERKKEEAYASLLECDSEQLASSHQIKRYFGKLSVLGDLVFNKILNKLFIWRLRLEEPTIIELGVDTMVLDNNSALKREGSESTYKRKRGFQPLHICWGPFLIDVMFRKGSAHSNHGSDYTDRVRAIVQLIRKHYHREVPILLCSDSGFADQKAYKVFEKDLHVHFITTGKLYDDVKAYVGQLPEDSFGELVKDKAAWRFTEFGGRLKNWDTFRRCIFTSLKREQTEQTVMDFSKPDSIIYTNIGHCPIADKRLRAAGGASYFEAEAIIRKSHQRGADKLIHRSIKELATKEQLPFKSFASNRAYYFLLVITHFMFEAYKRDVCATVIPTTVYPNTFRRKFIDFAVKITSHARAISLNVPQTVCQRMNLEKLWKLCQSPPPIAVEDRCMAKKGINLFNSMCYMIVYYIVMLYF